MRAVARLARRAPGGIGALGEPGREVRPPAAIMLLALALVEKDGVLLTVALTAAAVSLAITAGTLWIALSAPGRL